MAEQLSQIEAFRKELSARFIRQINEAIDSGEPAKLLEVMNTLAEYLVESSGVNNHRSSIGELDVLNAGHDHFTRRQLEDSGYSFMSGSEGERIYFLENPSQKLIMRYPKPSDASYDRVGKYYEKYCSLFGASDVDLEQNGLGVEPASSVLAMSDETLNELDNLLPSSELGEFLNNYDEAEKIANNLIQLRKEYSRKDLETLVVDIVLHNFPDGQFKSNELQAALENHSLAEYSTDCSDFVDWVEDVFGKAGGKISESTPLDQVNSLLREKCGPYHEIDQLPETKGTELLAGKRIIMVDDQDIVLSEFIPPLMVATGGTAEFIYHTEQSVDEIVDLIIGLQPEVILLDNKLAGGIMGPDVADQLRKKGYAGKIIGFSNNMEPPNGFLENGVMDHVRKDTNSTITSILGVTKLIGESNKNASS